MDGFDSFLDSYGLAASSGVMLLKAAGIPVPIPGDVIMLGIAARVAAGKMELWLAFVAILVALLVGGIIQFWLARGPARQLVYRYGRYLGLTASRLDAASSKVKKSGPIGIGLSILTPGIKIVSVAACGLAGVPLRTFAIGLAIGSALDLGLHFLLGVAGGSLLAALPLPLVIGLLVVGFVVWLAIRKWQRPAAKTSEIVAEAYEGWHEATCPVCLALGTTSRLRPVAVGEVALKP
jgi:membrane protein DedA with SNARE-associated domain